jgi:hypothetical protein
VVATYNNRGIYYFKAERDVSGLLVYLVILTTALIAVVVAKGERPVGWRWRKK